MVDETNSPVAFFFYFKTPIIAVPGARTWYLIDRSFCNFEDFSNYFSFSKAAILNRGISLNSKSSLPNSSVIGLFVTGSISAVNLTFTDSNSYLLKIL